MTTYLTHTRYFYRNNDLPISAEDQVVINEQLTGMRRLDTERFPRSVPNLCLRLSEENTESNMSQIKNIFIEFVIRMSYVDHHFTKWTAN